jgi:hypothetical protein
MSLSEAPRDIRRQVGAIERRERDSGKWSPLEPVSAEQIAESRARTRAAFGVTSGWASQISAAYRNDWIAVMVRSVHSDLLGIMVDHAAIRTALCAEFRWRELPRIKDEIFGKDRMAVQVYPRQVDLIDAADMYHLWVFPLGYRFDFGLGNGQR